MHISLIGKVEKANRYARELDRITIERLSLTFRGDNDTHHVGLDAGQWRCTCHYFESWGSCVHLLTLQKVFGVMLPEDAQISIFSAPEADRPANRANDGGVDGKGRFWFGTMRNNVAPDGAFLPVPESTGVLYKVEPGPRITPME